MIIVKRSENQVRHVVVLPKWVFEVESSAMIKKKAKDYLKDKYPGYILLDIEDGFALCDNGSVI